MNYQCVALCNERSRDFNFDRLHVLREKKVRACARRRREVVARQKRTLVIALVTFILGLFLALSTGKMSAQATGADQANNIGYRYYEEIRIENGDTLWSIAEAYTDGSVSAITECMEDIRSINNLGEYETIKSGDYVIVPYYSDAYIE